METKFHMCLHRMEVILLWNLISIKCFDCFMSSDSLEKQSISQVNRLCNKCRNCTLSRKMVGFCNTNIFKILQKRNRANYPCWKYYLARTNKRTLFATEQGKRILRIAQSPENPGISKSDWLNVLAASFKKEMVNEQNPQRKSPGVEFRNKILPCSLFI